MEMNNTPTMPISMSACNLNFYAQKLIHYNYKLRKARDDFFNMANSSLRDVESFTEVIKAEFVGLHKKIDDIRKSYNLKEDFEMIESVVKPFWDKYCELKKSLMI